MKPLSPNTLLQNRYLVVQLIGKGGMGEVYLAVDQRLGSAIALKRTFFSDDAQLGNAFEREARTLARLRHPVLPKVSDHFTEDGTQYLVMEHISGEDISKRLELSNKPFPLSWVLFWADHLLDALTYLHSYDPPIIHRDIKPQNLKLTDENNIILLDFGLAKDNTGDTRLTTSGSIVGYTPHYAPMEQIRGTGTDARSDIYSLSATLYQILTNVVPSDALTRADAFISGFDDPIKPINELNPEVSETISAIILKGMSVGQDKRQSSARDMQKELRDAYSKVKSGITKVPSAKKKTKPEVKPSQISTEVLTTPPPISTVQPNIAQENLSAANQQNFSSPLPSIAKNEKTQEDFDATWKMDTNSNNSAPNQPDTGSDAKQSHIKTEVFIAGSSPEITAAQNGEFDSKAGQKDNLHTNDFPAPVEDFSENNDFNNENFSKTSDFSDVEKFSKTNDFSDVGNFLPDSATPLFTSDNQGDFESKSDFDSKSPVAAGAAASFVSQPDASASTSYQTSTPVQKAAPAQKSSGKTYAIVGGVAAFFVLAVSAAGMVWYMFSGSPTVSEETPPAPTPQAVREVTPEPEPMLEAVTNTNTNSEEVADTNVNTNSSTGEQLADTGKTDKVNDQSGQSKKAQINQPQPPATVKPPTSKTTKEITVVKPPAGKKPSNDKKAPVKGSSSDILP